MTNQSVDDMVDLDFDRIEICPVCGQKTTYGEMIWLYGIATCPKCYNLRRAMLDADETLRHSEEV